MSDRNRPDRLQALLHLSHELGREDRKLSILAEGNTSTKLDGDTFLVKASGSNLGTLHERDIVECRATELIHALDRRLGDAEIETTLLASRVDASAKRPSVEALFHAWLLSLPGVEFVGHTHAASVNAILCSPRAREFAEKRIFPDEVVCCDVASVFVPYTDPGLPLAQVLREQTNKFITRHDRAPRVILLESHGIVTLGGTVEAVMTAMLMAEKAAAIWLGAASLGGPQFMSAKDIGRISGRPDEAHRRKMLKL